jgi:lipoprotein-anchoring transpeptidase ErfK/SrfK
LRLVLVLVTIGAATQAVLQAVSPAIAQLPPPEAIPPEATPAIAPPTIPQQTVPAAPPPTLSPETPAPVVTPPIPASPPTTPSLPAITSNEELHKFRYGLPPAETDLLRLEIRLSRRQVTLYRGDIVVSTYPIAVGKPGWETPTGTFKIETKIKDPVWEHPLKPGVVIPGGDPENPLGRFWIGFWTDGNNWIGFHGTPTPKSVGTAASHGCIRMYHQDVEALFNQVSIGTEVKVVR